MLPTLANAIIEQNYTQVLQFLQTNADLNTFDEYGFTPLIEAALVNNFDIAKILISYGAEVNLQDATGGTPLHWAVDNNNVELAQLLLEKGANPNAYTFAGQPALTMAYLRQQQAMKKLLIDFGANLSFTQDFVNAKLLGHIFELVGTADIIDPNNNFVELDFEGFYLEVTLAMISDSLEQFKNHFTAREIRRYDHFARLIVDIIRRASQLSQLQHYQVNLEKNQDVIAKLLSNEPVILPIGYEGHAITFIKAKNILVKCDRREDSRLYDNIMFYHINQLHAMNLIFMKNLLFEKHSSDYINTELDNILGLQPITELKVAAQISGNCSWANVEATIPALFFLLFSQAPDFQKNMSHYKNTALHFFHQWREWNKTRALNFCIQSFHQADAIRKACKAEILAAILYQCCKGQNTQDAERIEAILQILTQPAYEYILQNYIKTYCFEDISEEGRQFLRILKQYGYELKRT